MYQKNTKDLNVGYLKIDCGKFEINDKIFLNNLHNFKIII